jgi:hypothetical protein
VLRVVLLKFTKLEKVELNIRQPFGQVHVLLELSLAMILANILHRLSHETASRVVCKRGKTNFALYVFLILYDSMQDMIFYQ